MDEQKKPRAREKRVVNEGKGVQKQGEGLGTGPVNNTGSYEKRREQDEERARASGQGREAPTAGRPQQSGAQRPGQTGGGFPFGTQRPMGTQRPSGTQSGAQRPGQTGGGFPFGTQQSTGAQRPTGTQNGAQRPGQTGTSNTQRPAKTGGGIPMNQQGSGSTQRSSGQRASGGGGKLLMIIVALVVLFGGGKLTGLFGGDSGNVLEQVGNVAQTLGGESGGSILDGLTGTGSSGSGSSGGSLLDGLAGAGTGSSNSLTGGSGSMGDLLSMLMGSSGSSVYDFTGSLGSMLGGSQGTGNALSGLTGGSSSGTAQSSGGDSQADETVASQAREKFTRILGSKKDTVTLMVYMCGTDLESQNGMGTADLKEMAKAELGNNVNLIVYTGGCRRWRNNVVSSQVNQIYQIRDGGVYCLEDDMGSAAMTAPATLTKFIQYGQEHFPANRMCLILWDHGGGSVTGYGYDEKYGRDSMTLAGINSALKAAGVKFDFIGFDACLMATVENGLMLSQYADYMIASEETEPGVGWYYTNWLNKLSANTSMPTVQIGKQIADDFVSVCNQQCRGQATTLSVVDMAELQATLPAALKAFSADTNELIQEKEYKTVSTARAGAREFAQSSRIDQIDLAQFARNMKTTEGKALASALEAAVKYNKTGGGMTHAYGLSIYFPYKRAAKVNQMVSTYQAIGMDEEYTRCIQAFASMEVSGQVAAGTPVSSYSSLTGQGSSLTGLMGSLLGGGGSAYGGNYSTDAMTDLLGGLFGGSSGGMGGSSLLDLFGSRSLTAETAISYIQENHLDATRLQWQNGRISLDDAQWGLVESLVKNVFVDDGKGFIDLGCDNDFSLDGNDLVGEYDGTWMSINGQPVAYYYLDTMEEGDSYLISGYVPAILNGTRVNLLLAFDDENPYGYIAGAQKVYAGQEADTQAKNMIQIGAGDQVRFICDYYDYEGNYQDSYYLGEVMTLGDSVEIANTPVGTDSVKVTYCFTDIYQQQYWTPAMQ